MNIPVALIALVLIVISKPVTEHKAGAAWTTGAWC